MEEERAFLAHEDETTRARVARYFVPLLARWGLAFGGRVLCLGCGGGADVAELTARGFRETYGVEIAWRAALWESKGRDPARLFIADGRDLPFGDGWFDVVITLGVIEHVGAVGCTAELTRDHSAARLRFLREAVRVLRPGGHLVLACPNRTFPVDFQHNISRSRLLKALAARSGLSLHSPFDRFLLSYADVRWYAAQVSRDLAVSALPVADYLGLDFRNSPFLRPLARVFRSYLRLIDRAPASVRMSCLNPYVVVAVRRSGDDGGARGALSRRADAGWREVGPGQGDERLPCPGRRA